ncbi:hypothetical protein PCANC_15298 [Puccinia coronata f. sp. avenae]|uniref:Tet-like 2OG-Fe(II) oxygenase domain-containing protein n=1 Tax=Puccinia coronata f. sp. avenae TaxID=200324 RepID=A0A2N5UNW8_9BASI|nr:hypothetical protein PCANC_15298 [Puccinia coronata f. sp. avenae]
MVPPQTTHCSCEQPSHASGVNQPKAFAGGNSTTYADKVKANIWQATARRSARLVAKETQEVSHQAIATKNIKKKSHELAAIANRPRNNVDNVLPCCKVLPVTDGEKDAKALSWQSISNPFGHPAVRVDALSGRNILLASGGARDATVLSQLSSVHPLETSKTSGTFMKEDEAGSHHQSLLKDQRRSPTGTSGRAKIELLSVSEASSSDLSSLGEDEGRCTLKRQKPFLNAHQQMKRNACTSKRRKGKRERHSLKNFTSNAPPPAFCIIQKKVEPIDLFPAVTQDLKQRILERENLQELYENDPTNQIEPTKSKLYPRNPTNEENEIANKTVKDTFYPIESGYAKIYDKRNNQIIAMVEFIEFSNLSKQQWNDLNYLSVFLHQCKEFISPVTSQSQKCGGVMWALGWRKGYKELEILGCCRNQKAIDNNPRGFAKLMKKSSRVGQILWDTFHCFGNVAVEKNHNYMKKHNIPSVADNNFPKTPGNQSPFGFASNLAFSSHGFYNHQHKDGGDATKLPLAFALVIPTSKTTGKIATKSEGYDVDNGQFIFRDIQIALNFKPDVICRIIFRAQEYVHGTLRPTEPTNYTKLGISLQVATKTSNICKRYLKGEFDDDSDLYFSGVDKLLE